MIYVLLAAALFGAAAPVCKQILGDWAPIPLAGTLYLTSGIGLAALRLFRRGGDPLRREDLRWLGGSILFGGILAPIAILFGLRLTAGYATALLGNLETPFTVAIAMLLFRERLSRRDLLAMAVILTGAVAVAGPGPGESSLTGALYVAAACLCWGFDNNFTHHISKRDPLQIASVKGIVAGTVNLLLGASIGQFPPMNGTALGLAAVAGFFCYGLSLACFVLGLRSLGASRTAAMFATAPISGVLLSWGLLGEQPSGLAIAGGLVMMAGVAWMAMPAAANRTPDGTEPVHVEPT